MVIARYSNVHFVRKTVIHAKPSQRFFSDGQSDKAQVNAYLMIITDV